MPGAALQDIDGAAALGIEAGLVGEEADAEIAVYAKA